jgi:hypothetical protein
VGGRADRRLEGDRIRAARSKKRARNADALDTLGSLLWVRGDVEQASSCCAGRRTGADAPGHRLNYAKALIKAGRKSDAPPELEVLRSADDPAGKAEIAAILKEL